MSTWNRLLLSMMFFFVQEMGLIMSVWLEEIVNDILYLDGITEEATFYKFRFTFLEHKSETLSYKKINVEILV